MGRTRLGHYVLGMQGLALLRHCLASDLGWDERRVAAMRRLLATLDSGLASVELDAPEVDVRAGYADWSLSYDAMKNPLILVEEPAVRGIIDPIPPGDALDAGCGTGRHLSYLAGRGHRVIGVDATPEMLDRARARAPRASLRVGELIDLPVDDESMDLVVCALALAHVSDLSRGIAELARVARPGGRIVLSDFHPLNVSLGGQALFPKGDGTLSFVTSYPHQIGDYVNAAIAAGLCVRRCLEPPWDEEAIRTMTGPMFELDPDACREGMVGLPGALVLDLEKPVG